MTISQTVVNAKATRWLGDLLDSKGVSDAHTLAERITTELLAQGLAPVPRPFPLKATAPVASEEARRAAREAAAEAVAAAKAKRTRVGPPPTPSIEDLVAGAALLGLSHDDVATAIEQLNLPGPPADDQLDDDVVHAVIHEADCPGGHCRCGEDDGLLRGVADAAAAESAALHDAEPDAWRAEREATWPEPDEPSTWGPDDPPL